MQNSDFRPQMSQGNKGDRVAWLLSKVSENVLIIVLGLSPLFLIPIAYAPFGFSKTFFVLAGVVVALIFAALSVLRRGEFTPRLPMALLAFWGIAVAYLFSAVFSGDVRDSVIGDALDTQTAGFVVLLAVIMSAMMMFRSAKESVVRLLVLLIGSSIVLGLFHVLRSFFGPEFLSFGLLTSATATPYGSWNGLALFFGLILLIGMVALHALPLTRIGKIVLGVSAVLAIVVLALVNFYAVWVVLGGVSLVTLIYSLTQKHYRTTEPLIAEADNHSFGATIFTTIILAISILFILGGSTIGGMISSATGISYIEVRPSHIATFDILKSVYSENPITGIGPNKFSDAWRMHKDNSINETIFWNTNFDAGSGYIPTSFVTTGIVGVVAWAAFLLFIVFHGIRMLFRTSGRDRFWNFIGTASFVATLYLWTMAFVYVPSTTTLILTAACTGIFLTAYTVMVPSRAPLFSVASSRALGILFVGAVVLVIFGSVGSFYLVGQHYSSLYSFNKVFATATEGDTIDTVQERIANAFNRSPNDLFARTIAEYRVAQLNIILGIPEPTDEDREQFQNSVASGIAAAQLATEQDPTEPRNWFILGQIYSILAFADVEGASTRAIEAFDRAQAHDPKNPAIPLARAQLAMRTDNPGEARTFADTAVSMKRNYTDALLFLAQLDVVENNVEGAIARTRSIISLEPQNPARYYQLGVLLTSAGNATEAIAAFERAVALDPQYANARYFLALGYAEAGRTEEALRQMRVVAELNPDNEQVRELVRRLENNEPLAIPTASADGTPAVTDGQEVTAENADATPLVTPVNTVPDTSDNNASPESGGE